MERAGDFGWSLLVIVIGRGLHYKAVLNALERPGYGIQSILATGHSVMVVARRPMQAAATPVTPDPNQARGVSPMMAATYMRRGMAAEKQARYRLLPWRSVIDFAVL